MTVVVMNEAVDVVLEHIDGNSDFINYLASGAINTLVEAQIDNGKFNGNLYYYNGDPNDDGDSLWVKLDNKVIEGKIIEQLKADGVIN